MTWWYTFPHHTAVVASVADRGRVLTLLHQNVGGSGVDDDRKRTVQETTLRPGAMRPGGKVWIYRPIGPGDDPGEGPPVPAAPP
jgi:hypothetical protein